MRCFIAIDFPLSAKNAIAEIQAGLKGSEADVRWVDPERIHLTLWFFKDLRPEQAESLSGQIREAVQNDAAFEITLKGAGAFPHSSHPKVVWIGIQKTPDLLTLYHHVRGVALQIDRETGEKERNDFVPHATIGRVRSAKHADRLTGLINRLAEKEVCALRVCELVFFESRTGPEGPEYRALQRFPLKTSTS